MLGSKTKNNIVQEFYWIFILSKWLSGLIEESRNFILDVLHKKHLNIRKTISAHLKVLFLGTSKNYSSRDTISSREWLIVG
jgi:hypothetical protein